MFLYVISRDKVRYGASGKRLLINTDCIEVIEKFGELYNIHCSPGVIPEVDEKDYQRILDAIYSEGKLNEE